MTRLFLRKLGLAFFVLIPSSIVPSLHGCSSAEGVATQSEVAERCANWGISEGAIESLIIAAEASREEGFSKGQLLQETALICSENDDPENCAACQASIIDFVYD